MSETIEIGSMESKWKKIEQEMTVKLSAETIAQLKAISTQLQGICIVLQGMQGILAMRR